MQQNDSLADGHIGLGFLKMGTTGLAANALGAANTGPPSTARGDHTALQLLVLLVRTVLLAVALGLLVLALRGPALYLMAVLFPASPAVLATARRYFGVRVLGGAAVLVNNSTQGWLLGLQRGREVLAVNVAVNGVNVVLSLLLGLQLKMGVDGVAIATVLSQLVGLAASLLAVQRVFATAGWAAGSHQGSPAAAASVYDHPGGGPPGATDVR